MKSIKIIHGEKIISGNDMNCEKLSEELVKSDFKS